MTLQPKHSTTPNPPLKAISTDVTVGKDILELLSSSMYLDPMTIYREYVQNSADAIELAGEIDIGQVEIFLDPTFRTVRIRDNGPGIPAKEFVPRLTSVGASKKRGTSARGFRGVGRLAGLGYCRELVFRSLSPSDKQGQELVWDCRGLRAAIQTSETIDLAAVVRRIVSTRALPVEPDQTPFFEVELRGVVRHKNDQLLNASAISDYLSQVAPVPFHPEFDLGSEIQANLKKHVRLANLNIRMNGNEPIYRPHRNTFETTTGTVDRFNAIEWVEVPSVEGDATAAVAWFLHHSYQGAIPGSTKVKGVRLRSGDIQVGEGNLLEELFTEERFNAWSVGEVHVVDRRITPNGRRDHFEQNTHFNNLLNHLAPMAREISRKCRQSSIERKWMREFETHEKLAKQKIDIIVQRGAPKGTRDELLAEARLSLAKMARVSGQDGMVFLSRPELAQRHDVLNSRIEGLKDVAEDADPLGGLPEEKRTVYREAIRLIYRFSPNRVAAKALVDRILADVGLPPMPAQFTKT